MGNRKPSTPTLCFDCGNATNPDVCPWVRDGTPVQGWTAKPTVIGRSYKFDSYRVEGCPLFWRDGHSGGLVEDLFGRKRRVTIDGDDSIKLAAAICARAVEDWKFLGYGALKSVPYYGDRLYREELIEFFFSPWFEKLLGSFSERTPEQIRRYIHITDDMRPN